MKSDENVLGKGIEAIFAKTAHLMKGSEKTLELPNGVIRREGDELIIRLNLGKDDDIRGAVEQLAEAAKSGMLDQLVDKDKIKLILSETLQMVKLAIEDKDFIAASEELKSFLRFQDHPDLRFNLALLFEKANKTDSAIKQYKKVLELRPNDVATLNNLGRLLYSKGDLTQAMDCYQKAIKLNPELDKKTQKGDLFATRFDFKDFNIL